MLAVGQLARDTTTCVTRVRARAVRARLALVACVLWLGGVEALPALHESLHGVIAPHRHDGNAIVVLSSEEVTHLHADGTIHYAAPRSHGKTPARDGRPHATDGAGHAAGLAHHAAAIAPAAPLVTTPLPVDRRPLLVAVARTVDLVTRDPLPATARGPPSFA